MGGGDLNTKKSWHPKTMKNQEQVWKAERAASEERKRINELRNEYAQERDRSELNQLAKQRNGEQASTNDQLSWMYDKHDKKANHEDYLLGKAVDSKFESNEKKEPEAMRAVTQRVVGSSMMNAGGDSQVDLARKLREDPLILVKERERAARAALLNNPLQRKKITELLRKEQEKINEKKSKKSKKNDLDGVLASKLSALKDGNNIDLAALLASDDSSSSDSDDTNKKKKKKKKKSKDKSKSKKSKKSKKSEINRYDDSISKDDHKAKKRSHSSKGSDKYIGDEEPKHKYKRSSSPSELREFATQRKTQRDHSNERHHTPEYKSNYVDRNKHRNDEKHYRHQSSNDRYDNKRANSKERFNNSRDNRSSRHTNPRKQGLSEKEKAARLAEMAKAGHDHEKERSDRVAKQRADIAAEEKNPTGRRRAIDSSTLPTSLESRLQSNRHHIQKNERHMNEHFARR